MPLNDRKYVVCHILYTELVSLEPLGHIGEKELEVHPKCFLKRYLAYVLHPLLYCKISFESGI